jgi:hypothetical protein
MKPDFIRFIAPLRVIAVLYGLASSVNRTSVKMLCDIFGIYPTCSTSAKKVNAIDGNTVLKLLMI